MVASSDAALRASKLPITLLTFSLIVALFLASPSFNISSVSHKTPSKSHREAVPAMPILNLPYASPLLLDGYEESNHTLTRRLDPYAYTKSTPCHTNACCGSFFGGETGTCGFGPTFCGSDCVSRCDAKPECGQYANPPGKTCPLNVCCSAFSYVNPQSFQVVPMDGATPASLFTKTADVRTLKSSLTDLKVYISLGGWTFSDNGTDTQPAFGEITSEEKNRKTFADSLVGFIKKYGFDGVNIDWEYPGAPDRGGKERDTANFILLLRTLKETFNTSIHGPYGLTFTIPARTDWTNMMTYDLHGVWDKENPIGDMVQSHTNLTEIKQSMDLLWRNGVWPDQVVIGLGFYGRSFQLRSQDCSTPGCRFAGAAEPGSCTNSAGTLAYFEIQDIISDQNPKVTHDREAASKYFTYGKDQWVSFDDAETMKQKVDYANSVGLGGLMIWSVDQDDGQFSALQGLLGMSLQSYSVLLQRAERTDSGKWTSLNGQKCVTSDCGSPAECPVGYGMAPGGNGYPDNCGGTAYRIVCCPLSAMPESCTWRGGEGTLKYPSCHGQCHVGETTLFHSRHATKDCMRPGWQAFCCTAQTWARKIEACKLTSCRGSCGDGDETKGMVKVAKQGDDCTFGYRELCCPRESAFENCHWVGKGSCDDNECANNDVQLALDTFGDSSSSCAGGRRKKVLCCNTPRNLNPFLPVALDKVFPTLPSSPDYPQFDLQALGADLSRGTADLNSNTFGMVIIVGSESAVHTLRRRDGSDAHVLGCDKINKDGRSRIRVVCRDGGDDDSSCQRIHLGGAKGTILRLPEGCGPGDYAVLHAVRDVSDSVGLPHHAARSVAANRTVIEIDISHDFGLAKRDAGDILVRIDYSNSHGYWKSIVQGDPVKGGGGSALHKRFYSAAASDWKSKFDGLRNLDQPSSLNGVGAIRKKNIHVSLSGEQREKCPGKGDDGFLDMSISGKMHENLEFGFTFVGTISPTFHMEEANGFYDTNMDFNAQLDFDGKGHMDVPAGMAPKKLFSSPVSAWSFSHPGICSFGPRLNVEVEMTGKGEIDAKFSAAFAIANAEAMTDGLPTSTGPHKGGLFNKLLSNAWSGDVSLPTKPEPEPHNGKERRDVSPDAAGITVLGLRLWTTSQMVLDLDFYGQKEVAAGTRFNQTIQSLFRISRQSNGNAIVAFSNSEATVESFTRGDLPWGDDDVQSVVARGDALVLHHGTDPPPARDAPAPEGYPIFGGHDLMSCGGGGSHLDTCLCMSVLDQFDRTLDLNPDTGEPYEHVTDSRRRRRTARRAPYSILSELDPSLDLNPDTDKPYFQDLITESSPVEGRAPLIQYSRPDQ